MNFTMLLIVVVIIVPGYFAVKRISNIIYSDDSKFEENIENHYGFDRLEKQIEEKKKEIDEKNEIFSDLKDIEASKTDTGSIEEKK